MRSTLVTGFFKSVLCSFKDYGGEGGKSVGEILAKSWQLAGTSLFCHFVS